MSLKALAPDFHYAAVKATKEGEDNTLIAAVTGKSIVVLNYALTVTAEGTVTFKDSEGEHGQFDSAKTGGVSFAGGIEGPAFKCAEGTALILTTGSGVKATGHIAYLLV